MRIGKITENALKRSVLKQIKTEYKNNKSAAVGSDCAFSDKREAFSATSPVTAGVSDPGYYSVIKAMNNLFCRGIIPDHVTMSILLPEDAQEPQLREIVKGAIAGCKANGVMYAGGHTEVTTAVTRSLVTATAVGSRFMNGAAQGSDGAAEDHRCLAESRGQAGQQLVMSKWAGLEGTAMLAGDKAEELCTRYPAPFVDNAAAFKELLSLRREAEIALKTGVSSMHDVSSGGIFAALWEIAEMAGCGLDADLKAIPIRQETIEVCEFFEINPYQLLSGGALLYTTDDGERLVEALGQEGIPAAVIGSLQAGNDRILRNGEESRFLELPGADEIHKILG
jgi:hydrogenase maturation factor